MKKNKKIIALLPLKNEAWILETYLDNISAVADEIIILDDNSTDESVSLAHNHHKVSIVTLGQNNEKYTDFSKRRQRLLELGRNAGGTHFIWLDTDEVFSSNFLPIAREKILSLLPGQKIMMPWITLWKSTNRYVTGGSIWKWSYKDFIVCDSPEMFFEQRFIHENRTQGMNNSVVRISFEKGVVLHFQFVCWNKNQTKQALYRCNELLEGSRSAKRINASYEFTLDNKMAVTSTVPYEWTDTIPKKDFCLESDKKDWRYYRLLELFDQYGIEFFEPLQIWHIKELKEEFICRTKRDPISKTFPQLVLQINSIKNNIKNLFL